VRFRTTAVKRFKQVENATALIWKILPVAESSFRRLKGAQWLEERASIAELETQAA
jgi:putative transposase